MKKKITIKQVGCQKIQDGGIMGNEDELFMVVETTLKNHTLIDRREIQMGSYQADKTYTNRIPLGIYDFDQPNFDHFNFQLYEGDDVALDDLLGNFSLSKGSNGVLKWSANFHTVWDDEKMHFNNDCSYWIWFDVEDVP